MRLCDETCCRLNVLGRTDHPICVPGVFIQSQRVPMSHRLILYVFLFARSLMWENVLLNGLIYKPPFFLFTVCVLMLGDAGRDGLWYIHLKISLSMFYVSLLFVQFLKKKGSDNSLVFYFLVKNCITGD